MKTPMSHDLIWWGSRDCRQNGHDLTKKDAAVSFRDGLVQDDRLRGRIKLAACSASQTVVVTDTDEIFTMGEWSNERTASVNHATSVSPVSIVMNPSLPDDVTITDVTCGIRHAMVLLSNGQVYAFGNNDYHLAKIDNNFQTENQDKAKLLLLKSVQHRSLKQVACGDKHSLFLFEDGSLATVGDNSYGQMGDGTRKESSVLKPMEWDCKVKAIACGNNHNLAVSESGEVYVWGYCKGCGHRRHDMLSPELKLLDQNIVQVAGGTCHSLALSNSGSIYSWGFGTDGQLGLGEHLLTTSIPKRLRHSDLRSCVSYIACGESHSVAVTSNGFLYVWGKTSLHSDGQDNKPMFHPVCVNQYENENESRISGPSTKGSDSYCSNVSASVHSVQCGLGHAVALIGMPGWRPDVMNVETLSETYGDVDEDEDDGMTSDGSEFSLRENSLNKGTIQVDTKKNPSLPMLEISSTPPPDDTRHRSSQTNTDVVNNERTFSLPSRAQTKLTIGEFYAMTDSSPGESKSTTPQSSPRHVNNTTRENKIMKSTSPVSPLSQSPQKLHEENNATTLDSHGEVKDNDCRNKTEHVRENRPNSSPERLEIHHKHSPSSSPDCSVISECSLKKRIAENIERNKNINLKTRDWSGRRRPHRMCAIKCLEAATPSPESISPQGRLTPRASCRSKAASLSERSQTMFFSKSTSEHFSLPREQTFISKQSVSLMDLGNLRTGAVFDNHENDNHSRGPSASQFHSNSSSRLSMVSPYTENELRDILSQKTPDKTKESFQAHLSTSDTPSNMMRYKRLKDMSGFDQNNITETPWKQNHNLLFSTPSPNFGANNNLPGENELRQNLDKYSNRSRSTHGLPSSKHHRKPGLPGVDIKTKMARPGHLQGIDWKETSTDLPKSRRLTALEITPASTRFEPANSLIPTDPAGIVDSNHIPPHLVDLSPRRTHLPTGTIWRTKTMITSVNHSTNNTINNSSSGFGAFTSDGAFRKDNFNRTFYKNGLGGKSNNILVMKKGFPLEKSKTTVAISGAGIGGSKGQYLRQVNTSASSRNLRKK